MRAPSLYLDDDRRMVDGVDGGKQSIIQLLSGFFIHGGENMGVGIQGDADVSMAQTMLYDLRTNSGGNQRSRITMAKIMQTNFG